MGMKKACDVYGTTKDVDSFLVQIHRVEKDSPSEIMETFEADLGQRGYERLLTKIRVGVSEPTRKKKAT